MQFTDGEFLSAHDKGLTLTQWRGFIDWLASGKRGETSGSDYGEFDSIGIKKFSERVYSHLHLHCGFIAHYSRHGFFGTYFMSAQDTKRFFDAFMDSGWGDTKDLTDVMQAYYLTRKDTIDQQGQEETDSKWELLKELVKRSETDMDMRKQVIYKLLG